MKCAARVGSPAFSVKEGQSRAEPLTKSLENQGDLFPCLFPVGASAEAADLIDPGRRLDEVAVKAAMGTAAERNQHLSAIRRFSDRLE
jgi:hypothetical protein